MFHRNHYVPILKGREGEYGALNSLSSVAKNRITPLIELPPIPWDFADEQPARTIDSHLKKVGQRIERAWGTGRAFFLDLLWIPDSERMEDGAHPVSFVFSAVRNKGLSAIPVVNLVKDEDYLSACADAVKVENRGLCIRIQREDFADFPDLNAELSRVRRAVGTRKAETDVILDLRALVPQSNQVGAKDALELISQIPDLKSWRTFTVSATSFPENLTGLPASDISFLPRGEWDLWRNIVQSRVGREPSFGDYAISHPEPAEVDPRIMRPSAIEH